MIEFVLRVKDIGGEEIESTLEQSDNKKPKNAKEELLAEILKEKLPLAVNHSTQILGRAILESEATQKREKPKIVLN